MSHPTLSHLKPSFFDYELSEIKDILTEKGLSIGQCDELFRTLYHQEQNVFDLRSDLGGRSFDFLKEIFSFDLPKIIKVQRSVDKTVKFLMQLSDGQVVETVLVPFSKRYTVCLSSQVGCAMRCRFCFTGTKGLTRNLAAGEIVGQYISAWRWLKKQREQKVFPNIVFMGQGEPLHNFDQVHKSIRLFLSTPGLSLGPKQMTLSTVGHLPGLLRFKELPAINLAVSLHATNNNLRNELIPINQTYNLEKVFEVLDQLPLEGKKLVNYEYLLIRDKNDSYEDARELSHMLENRKAMVNIIPFNEFPGCPYKAPDLKDVENFKSWLVERKIRVMVRTTKGADILAACGQLANT